jgi:hypothetical protein
MRAVSRAFITEVKESIGEGLGGYDREATVFPCL